VLGFRYRQDLEAHRDRPLRLVELTGVDEYVVEDLLVEVNVELDAEVLEGLNGRHISIDGLVEDELNFFEVHLLLKEQSEVIDDYKRILNRERLPLVLTLLHERQVHHRLVEQQHLHRRVVNERQVLRLIGEVVPRYRYSEVLVGAQAVAVFVRGALARGQQLVGLLE